MTKIENRYDFVGVFRQGVAIVVKNGKYGAILQGGHEIINPSYDFISPFKDGYADAIKNGIFFVLNLSGNMCVRDGADYVEIPRKYQQARDFKDGLCCVCCDEKWGAIDKNGNEIIPTQYDYLSDFKKGVAIYRVSSRDRIGHKYLFGFLTKNGAVFPALYDSIWVNDTTGYIHTGYIERPIIGDENRIFNHPKRLDCNGRFIAKDKNEFVTLNGKYDYVEDFENEFAVVKKNNLWGVINKNEEIVILCNYCNIKRLGDDTFIGYIEVGKKEYDIEFLKSDGKIVGCIKNARNIIPLNDDICIFCINKIERWKSSLKYGIVSIDGKVLLRAEYEKVQIFHNYLYKVVDSRKEGIYDIQKGWILPCKYDSISYTNDFLIAHINNLGDFRFNFSGNCVVINEGKEIEVPKSIFVSRDFVEGYAPVCLGNEWAIINTSCRIIAKTKYDNIVYLGNSTFIVESKRKQGLYKIKTGELLEPRYDYIEKLSDSLFVFGYYCNVNYQDYYEDEEDFDELLDYDRIDRGKFGVLDITGKIILKPEYSGYIYIQNGYFILKKYKTEFRNEANLWLLADSIGNIIVKSLYPFANIIGKEWCVTKYQSFYGCVNLKTKKICVPSFDEIEEYEEGMLIARRDGLVFFLNEEAKKVVKKGEKWEAIPDDFYWMGGFHDGIARVLIDENAREGVFINESNYLVLFNGEHQYITLPPHTTYAYPYDNKTNCAIIKFGNAAGLINSNGDVICIPKYSEIERFNESLTLFLCKSSEGKYGVLCINDGDKSSSEIVECKYSAISDVKGYDDNTNEEYGDLPELLQLEEDGKIGVADSNGTIIISCEYSKVFLLEKSWLLLYKEEQDTSSANEKKIIPQYEWLLHNDYLVGLADIDGNIITPTQYSSIQHIGGSLFSVSKGPIRESKWGIMKADGKMLTPLMFDNIDNFDGTCISVEYKGHQGYVNTDGLLTIKDEDGNFLPLRTSCDFVFDFDGEKAIALYKDYQGYVNRNGKLLIKKDIREYDDGWETNKISIFFVLPQQYEWGFDFIGNYAKIIKDGKYGIVYCGFNDSIDSLCRSKEYKDGIGFVKEFEEVVRPLYDDIKIIYEKIDCYYSPYDLYFKEKLPDKKQIVVFICTLGGLQFVYDSNGTIVYKASRKENRETDLEVIEKNNYYGVVNSQGINVIPCLYDSVYIEKESDLIITNLGCMNASGKHIVYINDNNLLLNSKYRRIDKFVNDVAIVDMVIDMKLKYGLVGIQGEEILPPIFSFIKRLNNGMFKCGLNGKVGILNKNGEYIISNQFLSVGEYENGLSLVISSVDGTYTKESLQEYGYMDLDGNIVLSACSYISKQYDGLAVVCRCGKWGFYEIEQHTTTVVNNVSFLGLLHNDLAKANFGGTFSSNKVFGGKWGFVNRKGEIVINPEFDYVFNFSEGIAAVKSGDKYGFIDTVGTLIVPCEYDRVESHFNDGEGELVKGDKIYVFDRTGKIVSHRYVEKECNDYDDREDNTPSIYDNPYYNDNLDMDQQSVEFWNSL